MNKYEQQEEHGMKRDCQNKAFTLIEVMIAITILAIVFAVSIPSLQRARTNSFIRQTETQLEMLANAVLELAYDTGKYPNGAWRNNPGSAEIWNLNTNTTGLLETDGSFPNWDGPYLDEIPQDLWEHNLFFDPDYKIDGEDHVVVGSFGPNGVGQNQYDADDIVVILE